MAANAITITISKEYVYPIAGVVSTLYVLLFQFKNVNRARYRSKITYPQMYAEKAEADANKDAFVFNCAQRAHQNTLENLPIVLFGTLISGLKYPVLAGSLCGLWSLARIVYTIGYTTGDPNERNLLQAGNVSLLSVAALVIAATVATVSLFRAL